jgi:hypothetical protein
VRAISRRTTRARLVCAVLLALALRALIPIGFMPADDGTLSLMICPGDLPSAPLSDHQAMRDDMGMPMPQSQQNRHAVMDDAYCVFTTGFSSAPPPLLVAAFMLLIACLGVVRSSVPASAGIRLVHVPQARAPPTRA